MEIVWSFLKGSKIELHEIQQPEHGLKGGEPYFFSEDIGTPRLTAAFLTVPTWCKLHAHQCTGE